MARVLDFKQYLGGADQVITLEAFPRDRKVYTYHFDVDISQYVFSGDYQSLLLDRVTYDRNTGEPNFTDTRVLGNFDNYSTIPSANFDTSVPSKCTFVIPEERYTGKIYPNARDFVIATVVSFEWSKSSNSLDPIFTHRYVILERWEAGVDIGDPQTNTSPVYQELS